MLAYQLLDAHTLTGSSQCAVGHHRRISQRWRMRGMRGSFPPASRMIRIWRVLSLKFRRLVVGVWWSGGVCVGERRRWTVGRYHPPLLHTRVAQSWWHVIIIIFHTVQDTFSVYCVPGSTPVPQNPMNAMVMVMVMVKLILSATSPIPSPLHHRPSPLTPFPHPSYRVAKAHSMRA